MNALRELDSVAYVRFASVYRDFQDVAAFRDAVDQLDEGDAQVIPTVLGHQGGGGV
jgi:transcriptional repressor NrdR